jgi:riboflavin kinase/FMN adenylyltransferase
VGNNPTFTPDALSRVEAFLLDFSGDLYGQRIEVRFAHRLRGMERYDSLDALLEQMRADVVRTRELLSR